MSPKLLSILRAVDRETRALATHGYDDDPPFDRSADVGPHAVYPRDYYRPAELLWRWRGPGRFYWIGS